MIRLAQPLLPDLDDFTPHLEEIWKAGWLTNRGNKAVELEKRLQAALGAENLSLFCNGTIALLLGLKALKLSGEVITTPFTFPATAHSIDWAGLTPVFADVDPRTLNIDPAKVETAITERTSAILAVHVFGIPCDVEALQKIADKHQLKLIYDAAHAFGTEVKGVPIGQFGDMSMFSFHATKLFHTAEGGGLVYRDPALRQELYLLHNFGIQDEDTVVLSGTNGKMNELQAALGLCVLDLVEQERGKRARVVDCYREELAGFAGGRLLLPGEDVRSSCQYLPVLFADESGRHRDAVFHRLRDQQILARRYFRPLCSTYPCYSGLPSAASENLPVATAAERQILCLPLHGEILPAQVKEICALIRNTSPS
jgi:dTDP-4-amino-4,6-dideoxygalactose transaminase